MIVQVLANPWQFVNQRHSGALQHFARTDPGQLQELR